MFRNLQIYRWPVVPNARADALEMLLARTPCHQIDRSGEFRGAGFSKPCDHARGVLHSVGKQWLARHTREQKLLPAAVMKRELKAAITAFAASEGYPPGRKEVVKLKDRVITALLPRAFTQIRHADIWIDPKNGWLGIDAASPGEADAALESMYRAFEGETGEPARLHTAISPAAAMTEWLLSGQAPAGFSIDDACELVCPHDQKPAVRYSRQALTDPRIAREIRAHIEGGKLPRGLAMSWGQSLSFVLTDKGELKRLRPLEPWRESLLAMAHDTAEDRFDAEFLMMAEGFRHLLDDLVAAMGGEA